MKNTKQTKNVNQVNLLIAHNAMKSYIVEKACLNELKQGDTISYKKLIDLSCQSILDNDKSLILDTLIEKNENLLVIKTLKNIIQNCILFHVWILFLDNFAILTNIQQIFLTVTKNLLNRILKIYMLYFAKFSKLTQ